MLYRFHYNLYYIIIFFCAFYIPASFEDLLSQSPVASLPVDEISQGVKTLEPIDKIFIESIDVEEFEDEATIKIEANRSFEVIDFVLKNPFRLIIEVVGGNIFSKREREEKIDAFLTKKINIGYFMKDLLGENPEKRVDYLCFHFYKDFTYVVNKKNKTIEIKVSLVYEEGEEGEFSEDSEGEEAEGEDSLEDSPNMGQALSMPEENAGLNAGEGAETPKSDEEKQIGDLKSQDVDAENLAKAQRGEKDLDVSLGDIKMENVSLDDRFGDVRTQEAEDDSSEEDDFLDEDQEQEGFDLGEKNLDNYEKTETGLLIPKNEKNILNVLDKVHDMRKDTLFFDSGATLKDEVKAVDIKLEQHMGKIVQEFQRYTPLIAPEVKDTSLQECIQIAINNHIPAQIALEKIKLAKMKYWEARRNIFPKLSTNISKTKGQADALPFYEQDYKVSLDHTLFDGGEIKFLLEQAKVNLEVAKRTYDKVKTELAFEVEEAYYNFIMAKMNLATQRRLLGQILDLLKKAEYLYEQGLIRELDFSNAKSTYNQVHLQVAGTVKDYTMGELSLKQAMNVSKDFDLKIMDSIGFKNILLNKEDSLWLAYKYRPEYIVNKLMVDFQNYGRLASIAKESFRIDFSGAYGYGGSAFRTEVLHLNEQWNASLKISKTFGGNTVESNVVKDRAFPRLGQSSRGNSYTRSLKVSLLDNLKIFTDKKQSDITFQEAVLEVGKMEKQIETDVRNACFDYQKAIIQINSAFEKVAYREKEIDVNKTMVSLGESSLIQLMDTYVRLADEKSFYFQGLVNYYVAISNVNKAIGLIGYYN